MRRAAIGLACAALAALACHNDANIYTLDGAVGVTLFQVHDSRGDVLWRIRSEKPTSLSDLRYGRVPSGFVQDIPPSGAPPRLFNKGEKLVTVIASPEAIYRHEGFATGPAQFRGGYGETAPYRPDRLKDALEGRPITRDI
jgi:hypothetical protein